MSGIKYGTCPVCNGTKRVDAGKSGPTCYGYDKETHTLPCYNCGGQTQGGSPSGKVRLRPDETPCVHQYTSRNIGRCYNEYTCIHCGMSYNIDSGD